MKKFGYKNMLEKLTKFVFAIGLSFALLSCGEDSGLGSSIDTESPKITITYPPASAVIRESFVFGGSWSDDKVVNTITVSVAKVVDSVKTVVYTGDATVNEDKTWTITLNNYDSEKSAWEFIDGDYEISAVAKDGAGNKSGTASRGFSIDNTAPVLVLTKPTSYGSNSPKSYGRTVQFEGTFSEACTAGISKLLVSFFDESGNGLFDKEFTNINDMSNANPLVVAKFFDSNERDSLEGEDLAKWENYKKLYTAEQTADYDAHRDDDQYSAETKKLFFTVKATDNAKIYRDFAGETYESTGNSTTSYYRGTTEMLTLINSKNANFPDFTVLSLRKYLNHTDSTYAESEALKKIIDAAESVGTLAIDESSGAANSIAESITNTETKDANENAQLVYLNFSVNPQNNPTYTVGGLEIISTENDGEKYKEGYCGYYAGSSIGVSISAGLDGTALETSTISVYYAEVNDGSTLGTKKLLWTYNEAAAIAYAKLIDPLLAGKSDEDVRDAITKSDSVAKTYRYSITATDATDEALSISTTLDTTTDNISVGKKYAFIIEGNDIDRQEIIKYDRAGYGFFVKVNSSVPVISVDDYDANNPLVNKNNLSAFTKAAFVNDKISFSGTIEASEDLEDTQNNASVSYTVTVTDTKSGGETAPVTGTLTEGSGLTYQAGTSFTYDWSFTVDPSSDIKNLFTNGSGLYTVDLVITAKNPDSADKTGEKANVSRKYYLDDKASEFSAVSLAVEGTSDYSVYSDESKYYLNNKTSTFKLSGNVTDNWRTGSTYYKISGYTAGGAAQEYVLPDEKFGTNMQWEFSGITLSGFAPNDSGTDATITIVSVDEAGNTVEKALAIEFDTEPPVLLEDASHPFNVVVQGVAKTTDVYFKDSTLPISGYYTEKGSGVASGYYWVKVPGGSTPTTTDYASAGLFSVTNDSGTGISKFEKQSVGSFAASTISGENSVHNTLYLRVKDNVGNVSAVTEKTIKLDTSAPSLSSDQSGQQYTNLKKDFTVSGTYTDNVSGVVSVVLKMGSTHLATINCTGDTSGKWSTLIPANTLMSVLNDSTTTGNINATVTDAAGNSGISTIFSLTVDKDPPTITITSPEADSTINSKINMQGGATYDGAAPKTLTVYYFAGDTAPTDSTSLAGNDIGSFSDAEILTWKIENLDVKTLSGVTENDPRKPLYICTEVTDAAGNSKFEPKKYTVDQNKDRPIITFTGIDSEDSWLKSRTLAGTVTDDDGAVSSLKISVSYDGGNTWKVSNETIEVSNGSWNYEFDSDNANIKVKFSVTDAAGTVFTTDSKDRFTRPYYKYNTTEESDYATSQTGHTFPDYGLDDDEGYSIPVKVDTANPYYHTLGMDYGKEGTSLAAASTVAENASSYTVDASKYVGGDYKNVKFYVPVYDANGIASVTATVGEQNVTFTETTATVKSANTTYTYYESGVVDISTFTSGITNLVVTIKDIADNETPATASFTVDNTGPENIDIISPSSTESLTGDIDITGTVSDSGIGVITEIEWLIPKKDQYTYGNSLPDDSDVLAWDGWSSDKNLKTKTVFDFVFTSDTDKDLVRFENKKDDSYEYGVKANEDDTFTIPVFFRATDSLGNKAVKKGWYLTHNPDGDRPVTELTYPTERDYESETDNYVTLSGKIQVTGAVEIPSMTCSVEKTFIQIGKVTESGSSVTVDWTEDSVKSAFGTEIDGYELVKLSALVTEYVDDQNTKAILHYTDAGWWGLTATLKSTASVSSSWSVLVNNKGGLDPKAMGDDGSVIPTKIALRACSINENGKLGTWSEPVYIHVDNQAPVQSAEIRTYNSNDSTDATYLATGANIATSKTYETNMYLRGKKYLAITITDNDGINEKSLIVKQNGVGTSTYYTTEVTSSDVTPSTGSNEKSMQLFIPMETTSLGTAVTYNVYITDNADPAHTSSMTYSFKIDNDAPAITTLTGNDEDLLSSTPAAIVNSDYHYVLKSTVSDAGSGFEKLFFYFRRDTNVDDTGNRVLDPILKFNENSPGEEEYNYGTTAISGANLDSYTVEGVSGVTLYGKTIAGSLDKEKRTIFTPTNAGDITDNKHIRDGGLIYIAGEYQLIKSIGTDGKVTFANEIPTSITVTSAGFPYGQVIDTTDSSSWSSTSYLYVGSDSDGDNMTESVKLGASGTAWNLTAGLYSDNMTDGPVNLICIAFDIAGNISGKEIKTSIQNNAPRLAKLHLGTDLSGDGKYANAEFNTYTFATTDTYDTNLVKKYETSVEFKTAASTYASYGKPFKVKEGLAVVPELTGGNGTIKMTWLANASSNAAVKEANATGFYDVQADSSIVTATFDVLQKTVKNERKDDKTLAFVIPTADFTNKSVADGTGKAMSFTFWDSTEGAVCGTDSSYCFVRVTDFTIALNDTVAPKTVIYPFYWKGLTKNSVYDSSTATSYSDLQGHIELEADLSSADTSALGSDPKVSGKVTFEGYAYDDQRLGSIWVAFEGFTLPSGSYLDSTTVSGTTCYKAAQYNKAEGTWTFANATMEDNGWCFILDSTSEETYLSQDGHKVYYTFSVDTEKISTVAQKDVKAWVIACQDKSELYTSKTKVATTGDETYNVPFYQMDVVPYITSVKTSLSDVDETTPTAFSRTALGHYPVYMTYAGNFSASAATRETVTLEGFNLGSVGSNTVTTTVTFANDDKTGNSAVNENFTSSTWKFELPTGAKSGHVSVSVNGVVSRNNTNNDDAHGSYNYSTDSSVSSADLANISETMTVGMSGSNVIYKNYYNRQPNDANNNRLTDDVYLDVWQFNSTAVKPINNSVLDITMKINPSNGLIGFAFCNGDLYWSMPYGTTQSSWVNITSYSQWASTKDFIQCSTFAYDSNGDTYGLAAGGESASGGSGDYADTFNFFTSKWGSTNGVTYEGNRARRIGFTALGNYGNLAKDRFKSPSIVSNGTNVYVAYYDLLTGEIRFQGGGTVPSSEADFGTMKDSFQGYKSIKSADEERQLVQVLANGNGDALGYSGEYVSLGIAGDHVVMVWYDSKNNNLEYAYSASTVSNFKTPSTGINLTGWTEGGTILKGAGRYCQLAVAGDGSIHIACYDSANGDLKYVYLKDYTASVKKTCTVDSYLSVGKELTIDVAKSGNYQIPYIGYYGATPKKPRYAYLASPATFYDGAVQDGATDDAYTGVWECTIVPSYNATFSNNITESATRRINVGVWKTSAGVLKSSVTGISKVDETVDSRNSGFCYGNGTNNAVLSYGVRFTSSQDYGETAQKR